MPSSRPPPYQPLKQTSDSPEPEWVANPQVQQPGYPPQQPGYPPQRLTYPPPQPYVQPVQVQTQVRVNIMMMRFGRSSVRTRCPNCKTEQMTRTKRRLGRGNWACCGLIVRIIVFLTLVLVFPLLLLPLGFIALCIPSLMDVEHSCPNCNCMLGTFHP